MESEVEVPSTAEKIDSPSVALAALRASNGATIYSAEYATAVAEQFNVTLSEQASQLQPIHRMDRLQPDNEELGIGVGSLCREIVNGIDGFDAATPGACGHGRTQRMLKEQNIKAIADAVAVV